ncbi:hypothetical protein J6590_004605 [Homalodisca vitripennis]|nr:hypothetical protein J6590_004605 [Homalodisca vitripennis]
MNLDGILTCHTLSPLLQTKKVLQTASGTRFLVELKISNSDAQKKRDSGISKNQIVESVPRDLRYDLSHLPLRMPSDSAPIKLSADLPRMRRCSSAAQRRRGSPLYLVRELIAAQPHSLFAVFTHEVIARTAITDLASCPTGLAHASILMGPTCGKTSNLSLEAAKSRRQIGYKSQFVMIGQGGVEDRPITPSKTSFHRPLGCNYPTSRFRLHSSTGLFPPISYGSQTQPRNRAGR